MTTSQQHPLSGSTAGRPIAVGTSDTQIHSVSGQLDRPHYLYLQCVNSDTAAHTLTLKFGGSAASDTMTFSVPAKQGAQGLCFAAPLAAGAVLASADQANVLTVLGYFKDDMNVQALGSSDHGRPISIASTSSPGQTIHNVAANNGPPVSLSVLAVNVDSADHTLTVLFGGTSAADQVIVTVPAGQCVMAVSNFPLQSGNVAAFASAANKILLTGTETYFA